MKKISVFLFLLFLPVFVFGAEDRAGFKKVLLDTSNFSVVDSTSHVGIDTLVSTSSGIVNSRDSLFSLGWNNNLKSCWHRANASYYNSRSRRQCGSTRGVGYSGRKIRSGSVAIGHPMANFFLKGKQVFIEVKAIGLDIITPYGKNIFRVDDKMAPRFGKNWDRFFLDFEAQDLNYILKRQGRFDVEFRVLSF